MAGKANLEHLRNAGYVILENRIDLQLVTEARRSVQDKVKEVTNTSMDRIFIHPFEKYDDWPQKCKNLCQEIMKAVPVSFFRPDEPHAEPTMAIAVYQPRAGRFVAGKDQNALFYTVPLDEKFNRDNGMPRYIEGSHQADPATLGQSSEKELEISQGDLLVWDGRVGFVCPGTGGAAVMIIKWTWN